MTTLLIVSGLDPSGGAGFLADARVAAEHGVRAVGAITATTVQDTTGVRAMSPVAPDDLGEALEILLHDVEVDAVKIGMLGDARAALVIARALAATRAPVVWDPVLRASRGGVPLLVAPGGLEEVARALLPEVRVVTPNLDEAAALGGVRAHDLDGMRAAARAVAARGAAAVLVKGGHLGGEHAPDVLRDGEDEHVIEGPRLAAGAVHGTGCVLSSALACGLARGEPLVAAARAAKAYLSAKLARPLVVGRGARCLV